LRGEEGKRGGKKGGVGTIGPAGAFVRAVIRKKKKKRREEKKREARRAHSSKKKRGKGNENRYSLHLSLSSQEKKEGKRAGRGAIVASCCEATSDKRKERKERNGTRHPKRRFTKKRHYLYSIL